MANASFVTQTQPSLKGSKIPAGHVILNPKYRTSALAKHIPEFNSNILYDDTIGLIDCYPSSKCAVIILQEAQLIAQTEIRQKLRKLKKFPHARVALVEVTETGQQYFKELQESLMFGSEGSVVGGESVHVQVIPVGNLRDAALAITQLMNTEKQVRYATLPAK